MSRARALEEARVLKGFLEARGVRVSIELVEGTRKPSGWILPPGQFRVEMSHHIVSARSMGLTPFLHLVKVGRPDVKGPLCNGYGGFDRVYRIITMGVANHSGRGGPMTLDGITVAKDVAAYFAWGTEYEGGMNPRDWDPPYRRFMAASNAGIIDYLRHRNGKTTDQAHCEHSTWAPGRKSDRMLYTRAEGIAEIRAARTGGSLVTYSADHVREVQTLLNALGHDLVVDGDLGPVTRAAVEAFQKSAGLVVDGDPGPITLQALRGTAMDIRFIRHAGRVYTTDGVSATYIDGPTALGTLQKIYGTREIFDVPESVINTLARPGITKADVRAAVTDAVGSLPGGLDADAVAGAVLAEIGTRLGAA